jgi:hypothetical protein
MVVVSREPFDSPKVVKKTDISLSRSGRADRRKAGGVTGPRGKGAALARTLPAGWPNGATVGGWRRGRLLNWQMGVLGLVAIDQAKLRPRRHAPG